ncbi:hypothetical protein SAMD00019534_094890 [Acytostelium subglobosum LB1]|uniref:hypothetical protein n=1 Tax=Acytostelium subglobosum LB1 TaxID=1410327 RepID=UPI000644F520|nr:hypothetical protein SAMD00019534_094890 [Acytostelium subglobosum LB1]GAM26314.1 hypothetical protein SAMD00019534_094890 [Acytostelium subglobosum LB1]|eukprot:XP_012750868.1 hypothetical protein SAMD00019534_094890 [Acytostelium subglobosum LB1]
MRQHSSPLYYVGDNIIHKTNLYNHHSSVNKKQAQQLKLQQKQQQQQQQQHQQPQQQQQQQQQQPKPLLQKRQQQQEQSVTKHKENGEDEIFVKKGRSRMLFDFIQMDIERTAKSILYLLECRKRGIYEYLEHRPDVTLLTIIHEHVCHLTTRVHFVHFVRESFRNRRLMERSLPLLSFDLDKHTPEHLNAWIKRVEEFVGLVLFHNNIDTPALSKILKQRLENVFELKDLLQKRGQMANVDEGDSRLLEEQIDSLLHEFDPQRHYDRMYDDLPRDVARFGSGYVGSYINTLDTIPNLTHKDKLLLHHSAVGLRIILLKAKGVAKTKPKYIGIRIDPDEELYKKVEKYIDNEMSYALATVQFFEILYGHSKVQRDTSAEAEQRILPQIIGMFTMMRYKYLCKYAMTQSKLQKPLDNLKKAIYKFVEAVRNGLSHNHLASHLHDICDIVSVIQYKDKETHKAALDKIVHYISFLHIEKEMLLLDKQRTLDELEREAQAQAQAQDDQAQQPTSSTFFNLDSMITDTRQDLQVLHDELANLSLLNHLDFGKVELSNQDITVALARFMQLRIVMAEISNKLDTLPNYKLDDNESIPQNIHALTDAEFYNMVMISINDIVQRLNILSQQQSLSSSPSSSSNATKTTEAKRPKRENNNNKELDNTNNNKTMAKDEFLDTFVKTKVDTRTRNLNEVII